MMDGLPAIDAATLARMPEAEQRELLVLLDRHEAIRARDDFTVYCRRTIPGFIASPFHREICELLMGVERGDFRRLLIEAPVRFGKTRIAAQTFPAWAMARRRIPAMLCSYGGDLAIKSGRKLRSLVRGDAHLSVFPEAGMNPETTAADQFELANGSEFMAAGTNGPIMGRGWKLGILDDLLKGREAADSAIQREAVWEWFENDFMSREELSEAEPSALVFITARWSDDDPAGRIRERVEAGIEDWEIRTFAALDENDESLCEELRPAAELRRVRAERPARVWGSLYMSNPVPDDGDIFRREWFVASDRRLTPADGQDGTVNYYAAADLATLDGAGDHTALVVFGVDTAGRVHIVHVWRRQASPAAWVGELIRLTARWRPMLWAFGAGALFRAVEPLIRERMNAAKTWVRIETFAEAADKPARSQAFAGLMENDRVRWDQTADWYPQAESELLRFPAGRSDDVVDACSLVGAMMNGLAKGRHPAPPEPDKPMLAVGDYGDEDLPDGFKLPTWNELVGASMKRRRRFARLH